MGIALMIFPVLAMAEGWESFNYSAPGENERVFAASPIVTARDEYSEPLDGITGFIGVTCVDGQIKSVISISETPDTGGAFFDPQYFDLTIEWDQDGRINEAMFRRPKAAGMAFGSTVSVMNRLQSNSSLKFRTRSPSEGLVFWRFELSGSSEAIEAVERNCLD
jgi:hypothetical protein